MTYHITIIQYQFFYELRPETTYPEVEVSTEHLKSLDSPKRDLDIQLEELITAAPLTLGYLS